MTSPTETIHFHLAKVDLTDTHKEVLSKFVNLLPADATIHIDAHACATPVVTPESLERFKDNEGFSAARAYAVRDALTALGVPTERIRLTANGSRKPLGPDFNANRRVHLLVNDPIEPSQAL